MEDTTLAPSAPNEDARPSKLDHALAWARGGFDVFPLIENTKLPAIDEWQLRATRDEAQIRRWWSANPATGDPDEKNIGIATGRDGGVYVVDVDTKHEAAMRSLTVLELMWLDTSGPCVETASGGLHLYYRLKPGVPAPRNRAGLRPGIDVRGWHGFVVAPGSVVNGKSYRWTTFEEWRRARAANR
jgi:hypothetical protein